MRHRQIYFQNNMARNLINTEWLIYLVLYLSIGYYFSRDTQGILNKMMSNEMLEVKGTVKFEDSRNIFQPD